MYSGDTSVWHGDWSDNYPVFACPELSNKMAAMNTPMGYSVNNAVTNNDNGAGTILYKIHQFKNPSTKVYVAESKTGVGACAFRNIYFHIESPYEIGSGGGGHLPAMRHAGGGALGQINVSFIDGHVQLLGFPPLPKAKNTSYNEWLSRD